MKISEKGINLITEFEGLASKKRDKIIKCTAQDIKNDIIIYPYFCEAGIKTIGIGCVIECKAKYDNGVKISEIMILFKEKIAEFENMLNKWLKTSIKQLQFDALLSFCFNIPKGAKAICEMLNENASLLEIEKKWLSFCNIKGIKNAAIFNRRKVELDLFNN